MPFADEVMFGVGPPGGQVTCGEMAVRWYPLHNLLCPRLEVFDDGWRVLSTVGDVLERMGRVSASRNNAIAPTAFCALLEAGGFVDRTPVQQRQWTLDDGSRERNGTARPER
ncbi:hypothetical protein [Paraburkholderia tropica]|uniref:hypothetical protein n=1 Tax=Paraburkholderia tropica TaxID=92647 RepID=UPI002AB629DB|nr:hypothetical protein [Paraburkholderia tropica]